MYMDHDGCLKVLVSMMVVLNAYDIVRCNRTRLSLLYVLLSIEYDTKQYYRDVALLTYQYTSRT